jgi:hypothetical protein
VVDLLEAKVMFGAIEEEVVVVPTGAEAAMVVVMDVTVEDEVLVDVVEFEIGLEAMGTAVVVDVVEDEVAVVAYAVSDEFVVDVVEDEVEVTVVDVVADEVVAV